LVTLSLQDPRLCRKLAFVTVCAMVSPGDLRHTERENDDGDQWARR
jgi:hypothetical protein